MLFLTVDAGAAVDVVVVVLFESSFPIKSAGILLLQMDWKNPIARNGAPSNKWNENKNMCNKNNQLKNWNKQKKKELQEKTNYKNSSHRAIDRNWKDTWTHHSFTFHLINEAVRPFRMLSLSHFKHFFNYHVESNILNIKINGSVSTKWKFI